MGAGRGTDLWREYTNRRRPARVAAGHLADLKRRVRYYPDGPLADSYHRGRRGKYLRCHYDSIRVSPSISVTNVRYLYEEAVQAGGDHALVIAEIELA